MENPNSIEDIKLSDDFYLCLEDKVLLDTLILDYDRLLREVKDNALSFDSKSDYIDFVKKVEANKEKIIPLSKDVYGPIAYTYWVDYDNEKLWKAYASEYVFGYDNKKHALYVESYTTEEFEEIF